MKKPTKPKQYKAKKCAQCSEAFTPVKYLQKVCGPVCAIAYQRDARNRQAERERKDKLKVRKKALLTRGIISRRRRPHSMRLSASATKENHVRHAATITHR